MIGKRLIVWAIAMLLCSASANAQNAAPQPPGAQGHPSCNPCGANKKARVPRPLPAVAPPRNLRIGAAPSVRRTLDVANMAD
jgi:hypothetical protein